MKKLKLNLDLLAVDSFHATAPAQKKGTVFGEQDTVDWSCGGSCWYTECGGNTVNDRTCNPSVAPIQACCPM